jgi:6-pyruvoyltetrahydropterin/6-carboxytetrahydropterin synthase
VEKTIRNATRYHDFSAGHRVHGHENKCAYLHGHNYRVTFIIAGDLDLVGRVLDFGTINKLLCQWLEENWDHKFLLWNKDNSPFVRLLATAPTINDEDLGIVFVPFNPTAENMASYLLEVIGPQQLKGTGAQLVSVKVEETRKCSASATLKSVMVAWENPPLAYKPVLCECCGKPIEECNAEKQAIYDHNQVGD